MRTPKPKVRLVRHLQTAARSLQEWEASLRSAAVPSMSSASDQRWSAAGLLEMIHETQEAVVRRLRELGIADSNESFGNTVLQPATKPAQISLTLKDLVNACRACGQAIGAAFREAQARADAASARILYGALRELEKQLWILDPRQAF